MADNSPPPPVPVLIIDQDNATQASIQDNLLGELSQFSFLLFFFFFYGISKLCQVTKNKTKILTLFLRFFVMFFLCFCLFVCFDFSDFTPEFYYFSPCKFFECDFFFVAVVLELSIVSLSYLYETSWCFLKYFLLTYFYFCFVSLLTFIACCCCFI